MATKTTNYNFELPEENDFYDIHLENANIKKIDTALQENKQNINNHKNNTDIHLSEEQIEKINSALQPTQNAVRNNFVKYNANGTISDSGFNGDSFTPANHIEKSVYSQNGVHNLRYNNDELQVYDGFDWINITANSLIKVYVSTRSGSIITVTNGETVITGEAVDDLCIIKLPNFGDWTFTATLNGITSEPVILTVDTVKKYEITVSLFRATLNISTNVDLSGAGTLYATSPSGKITTYSFSGINEQIFSKTLNVEEVGEWSFYYTYNGYGEVGTSETIKLIITDEVLFETINLTSNFARLTINFNGKDEYPYYLRILNAENNVIYEDSNATYIDRMMMSKGEEITIEVVQNNLYYFNEKINLEYKDNEVTCNFPNIYGVQINENNADPNARCVYIEDAEAFTGGSSEWDNTPIFDIHPVAYDSTGQECYLNKNDFSKTIDDKNLATYGLNEDYNIMIRFPELHYRIDKDTSNNILKIYISNLPFNNSIKWNSRDIGAYLGYVYSDRVESRSGYSPTANISLSTARRFAKNNGDSYRVLHYYDWLMLQMLFILREKHTNPASFGVGNTFKDTTTTTTTLTGITDKKGMYYGSTSRTSGLKYMGIEDLWGNLNQLLDGLTLSSKNDRSLMIDGETKGTLGSVYSGEVYFKKSLSETFPFITQDNSSSGSSSTYYCNAHDFIFNSNVNINEAYVGGGYKGRVDKNLFYIRFTYEAQGESIGIRLVREVQE